MWCTSTWTGRSLFAMTWSEPRRVAILGTGLIGTSIGMAARRNECAVRGFDEASASLLDGIAWVLTPTATTAPEAVVALERWVGTVGAEAMRMAPARHDRMVAMVSHLPQVASTALMGLAATEEADEPEILLLAAGGFRDLTRLAASNPPLWGAIP